jgi:hypothetical protein
VGSRWSMMSAGANRQVTVRGNRGPVRLAGVGAAAVALGLLVASRLRPR